MEENNNNETVVLKSINTKGPINLIISLAVAIIGIIFIFNTNAGVFIVNAYISLIFIVMGIYKIIDYFRFKEAGIGVPTLIFGIFTIFLGVVFFLNSAIVSSLISLVVAVSVLLIGVYLGFLAKAFMMMRIKSWLLFAGFSFISIILSLYLFFNLSTSMNFLILILGIYFLIVGIGSLIGFIFNKK